jgi:hypothetical protein
MELEYHQKTPVALFLWKRPENTRNILKRIIEYNPPEIFLIIDGPRNKKDQEIINSVKSVINELLEEGEIRYRVNAAENHMGLFKRFTSGFDWIFSFTEEIIILEDDTIPANSFFQFCNVFLNKYRNNRRVVAINGFFMISEKEKKSLAINGPFFRKHFGPWGWATWKNKFYETYQPHTEDLNLFQKMKILVWVRNLDHFFKRYNVLKSVINGQLNVWAVQFQWNILEQKKLVLSSHINLIRNNGLDEHAATQIKNWEGFVNIPLSEENTDWFSYKDFKLINDYEIVGYNRISNTKFVFRYFVRKVKSVLKKLAG